MSLGVRPASIPALRRPASRQLASRGLRGEKDEAEHKREGRGRTKTDKDNKIGVAIQNKNGGKGRKQRKEEEMRDGERQGKENARTGK